MKNRLKILRAENGLTQAEAAKLCELSRVAYNRIENNRVKPRAKTIEKLALILKTPQEEIFIEEDPISERQNSLMTQAVRLLIPAPANQDFCKWCKKDFGIFFKLNNETTLLLSASRGSNK